MSRYNSHVCSYYHGLPKVILNFTEIANLLAGTKTGYFHLHILIIMKITDKYIFFWDGVYSQWYPEDMQIDGTFYNCCEQYMMEQKALLFGDKETAKKIMKTSSPAEQKALGRSVKNFDRDIWDQHCMSIVIKGNYGKFAQPGMLRKDLMRTGNRIIVEASPYDKIWGIGMGENDPGIEDPANWKGLNLLGHAIMTVRSLIIFESYNTA